MYKHLLIAVDGSGFSDRALNQGLELAKTIGAKVTIIHVTPPWSSIAMGEVAVMFPPEEYERNMAEAAAKLLVRDAAAAKALVIDCETVQATEPQPHKAIVDTAAAKGCDLIVMGSHGRRGIAGLLMGSVTQKTLTHSNVPVLVYRE